MFNYLINDYPTSVFLDDKEYDINSDFKTMLKIIEIIDDDLFTQNEKINNIVYLFYVECDFTTDKLYLAYEEIIKFMSCYKESEKSNKNNKRTIDYSADSSFIYSAFIQLYQIDLSKTNLHWFKFSSLINNLNDGKPFIVELMQCRSVVISESMSVEQKKYYRKMQKEYAIEHDVKVTSFADSLFGLTNGGVNSG